MDGEMGEEMSLLKQKMDYYMELHGLEETVMPVFFLAIILLRARIVFS